MRFAKAFVIASVASSGRDRIERHVRSHAGEPQYFAEELLHFVPVSFVVVMPLLINVFIKCPQASADICHHRTTNTPVTGEMQ